MWWARSWQRDKIVNHFGCKVFVFVYLCICVFVFVFVFVVWERIVKFLLSRCNFVYLCICVFLFIFVFGSKVCTARCKCGPLQNSKQVEASTRSITWTFLYLSFCVFVYFYFYLCVCICICVFVFAYLCFCICIFVFGYFVVRSQSCSHKNTDIIIGLGELIVDLDRSIKCQQC